MIELYQQSYFYCPICDIMEESWTNNVYAYIDTENWYQGKDAF